MELGRPRRLLAESGAAGTQDQEAGWCPIGVMEGGRTAATAMK